MERTKANRTSALVSAASDVDRSNSERIDNKLTPFHPSHIPHVVKHVLPPFFKSQADNLSLVDLTTH